LNLDKVDAVFGKVALALVLVPLELRAFV